MFIGLEHIEALFVEYQSIRKQSAQAHCLCGWIELEHAPTLYQDNILYVCKYEEGLEKHSFISGMQILCYVTDSVDLNDLAEAFPDYTHLLLIQCDNSQKLYEQLINYFNLQCGSGLFAETLLGILSYEGGIQAMVDHAYQAFGNPIFVFDAGFNLIAANWEETQQKSIGMELIENKGFTRDAFEMANSRNHIHDRVQKSDVPILAYNPVLGHEQLLCAINTQKDVGHIVVSATNQAFHANDSNLLQIIKRCIDQQLKKDEFIRNTKGFHYEYFLKDLLDGKVITGKLYSDRLDYVHNEFSGNLYCLVIETARSSGTLNTYRIRNLFENRFSNTKTLMYNGGIIIILNMLDKQLLSKESLKDAIQICKENGLFAGMSNCFQNIMELYEYYKQALRAIELGIGSENIPNLFIYEDYFMEHLKNIFIKKESSKIFCHPKMKLLFEYDKKHDTELAYTLYMYLTNERNIAAASSAMHMHRNSLSYRMNKIDTLIGNDYESYRERQYMILSYELHSEQIDVI